MTSLIKRHELYEPDLLIINESKMEISRQQVVNFSFN